MEYRTSTTHPLQIATVETPGGGRLGLTLCPGKYDPHAMTGAWARDLATDLAAVRDWGATTLVTLMETAELRHLRVPDLGTQARALGRTGLVAARLRVKMGETPVGALRRIREVRRGAVETLAQEKCVLSITPGGKKEEEDGSQAAPGGEKPS